MSITSRRSIHTGNRLYECDQCGERSPWEKGWLWYGSLRDVEDEPTSVWVFCSQTCLEAKRLSQFEAGENPLPVFDGAIDG